MPTVSVVVPTHERPALVAEAIDSIRAQTRPPDEIVVVDDGSSPAASLAVPALARDDAYVWQPNAGLAAARNAGVAYASGECLAFLDDDDVWLPHHLETLLARLEGEPSRTIVLARMQFAFLRDGGVWELGELAPVPSLCAALVPRQVWDELGGLDETVGLNEDVDWFVRLQERRVPLARVPEVTGHYRRHPGNMTNDREAASASLLGLARKRLLERRTAADGRDTVARDG